MLPTRNRDRSSDVLPVPASFDVQTGHFSVQDFLDFDPKKKPNPLPRKRPQFALANAIDTAFHADRVGPANRDRCFESQSKYPTFTDSSFTRHIACD